MTATSLLDAHLEQISLCAASIAELPFPPPKIFTNALLRPHDITTLIRDTEAHERALFSVPPPPAVSKASDHNINTSSNRRNTTFNPPGGSSTLSGGGPNAVRAPRRNTAVAAVLGTELVERIRQGGGGGAGTGVGYGGYVGGGGREKGEVDVEVLLEGAKKLCGVYPIPGALQKIAQLHARHSRLVSSIEHYEVLVAEQASELARMNKASNWAEEEDAEAEPAEVMTEDERLYEEDLRRDEEEIRELEAKKRMLEDRVSSMGKDITGVLRF
ncbi:DASH complex, subunit Spc34 [Patellaria atrata CBS 101060]|uniref:DASH complex subunit SPC34 n=1 Tax=Patellaria atrata CBS 101060 TaxID=1346257 RepID=A0A9P4VNT2_9PEZI|nr:DASH complex, subunit Spc34 [Patellaria atrata CBS 101060]